jgi:hypothetical protein
MNLFFLGYFSKAIQTLSERYLYSLILIHYSMTQDVSVIAGGVRDEKS